MIWAYPITPCQIEDSLVCCVKDNPEPAVFRLSCHGLRPELELDRKQLHFDKVLLHRCGDSHDVDCLFNGEPDF